MNHFFDLGPMTGIDNCRLMIDDLWRSLRLLIDDCRLSIDDLWRSLRSDILDNQVKNWKI